MCVPRPHVSGDAHTDTRAASLPPRKCKLRKSYLVNVYVEMDRDRGERCLEQSVWTAARERRLARRVCSRSAIQLFFTF